MDAQFWEIAEPFTRLTAREIAYGDANRLKVFEAVMVKIGHPVEIEGCLICVSNALRTLENNFKQYQIMTKRKKSTKAKYILKPGIELILPSGRYDNKTLTDEVAEKTLAKHPEYVKFFAVAPEVEPEAAPEPEPETVEIQIPVKASE